MSPATATLTPHTPLLSDAPLGEISIAGDTMQVVFRRHYRAPAAKLWSAITTPERLADWFGKATVDLKVGGALHMEWGDFPITVCDPPKSLAWSWELDGRETLVRFDITPEAGGCGLVLTHSGLSARPGDGAGVRAGWHAHLEALPDAMEGRSTPWETKVAREKALAGSYPTLG
ncbi:MAG: SRPBCC family protein [Devosia sp.]